MPRRVLYASVSALAVLVCAAPAHAVCVGRCGGAATGAVTTAATSAIAGAQQAVAATQQSMNSLTRATLAIQAMQAAQTAARNLALSAPNSVPNGLVTGGLVPDSGLAAPGIANSVRPQDGGTWSGANTPTQTTNNGQTVVTIQQTQPQAILNWQSFNVGANTTVDFNQQGNANWAALNKISATGVPSQILGSIRADGQVYLINQSGIIFGGSSQVNVGSLIASTLPITDQQFLKGIVNQNAYDSINQKIFDPVFVNTSTTPAGNVTVEPGAIIQTTAPQSVTTGGGFVYLFGSNVSNSGAIITPDGQAVLAAGSAVYLTQSTDPNVRGVQVNLQNGGTVVNTAAGLISAPTGNISLVGLNVQQAGVLLATTSVDEAGSISLIAHDGVTSLTVQTDNFTVTNYYVLPTRLGTVELSPGSLTAILPEENGLTALDGQPQGQSVIRAEGQTVNVLSNASIVAPSGAVSLEASTKAVNIFAQDNPSVAGLSLSYGLDAGRVYVADGVIVDVSGLQDVPVSASDDAVMVNVRSNELRDSPINRNGILYGSNVWVNVNDLDYVGTDQIYTAGGLLEVSGWLGLVPRTIDQRLTTGGSVSIFSTGDAILRPGASINIAGGSLAHQAGYVQTTRLVGSDGRIYDINDAPGDMTYVGFAGTFTVGHSHWGVTETYVNPLVAGRTFQGAYTEGKSAGSLSVVAPQAEIDAAVNADAVNGVYQRSAGNMAQNGALTIGDSGLIVPSNVVIAPTVTPPPDVFANSTVTNGQRDPATLLPSDQQQTLYLSAAKLDDADYGSITITSGSGIANPVTGLSVGGGTNVVDGATLQVANGGSISLTTAASISIAGQLVAHAGAVSFDTSLGTVTATRDVVLKPGSVIDVSGLWTNDALDPSSSAPTLYNGGNVTIDAKGSVLLGKGTLIDASSGGWMQHSGKLKTGANGLPLGTGGNITLVSNYQVTGTNPPSPILYPGKVVLGGTLRSYGFAGGGRLTIAAPAIVIGGNNPADGQTLWLDTGFFARGGFGEYALVSYNATTVAPGADIELHAQTLQPTVAAWGAPTGASIWSLATLGAPLPFQNAAPVNLVLSAADPLSGALTIGAGAQINTDPGATVKLHASLQLTFDGVIDAPGGTIDLDLYGPWSNGANYLAAPYSPARTLWIGSDARLLAPGLVQTFADASGGPSYRLWHGGSVNINEYGSSADYMPYSSYLQPPASNTGPAAPISPTPGANVGYDPLGTVVALAGSVIDVSGVAGVIATPSRQGLAPAVASMLVATDAGSLSIMASQGLLLDSTLFAQGGGPTSAGGSFSVDQTMWAAPLGSTTYRQPVGELVLTQGMQSFVPTGLKVGDAIPAALQGQLHVSADAIMNAGFASVSLGAVDAVVFNGNVNLQAERSITINARVISATPGANVQLASAYVDIGGGRRSPNYDFNLTVPSYLRGEQPLAGTANLTVNAALIDIEGVLSSGASYTYQPNGTSTAVALPGFANMTFNSQGDIRLVPASDAAGLNQASFLQTLGNLNFTSAQIYPITSEPVSGATANNAPNAQFVVRATGAHSVITIARNGAAVPPVPLSAGGDVDFIAPIINQGGVLRAPIGQITFGDPTNSATAATINLLPGSITSVSADGLLIPWGTPVGNNLYEYGDSNVITTPPQKIVSFYGQSVNVQSGAMIDESGGGDLYGYQFVSGAGGSVDTLNGVNTFAILPSLGSAYAPRSPLMESSNGSASGPNVNLKVGDQIYLSGIPGLAAGYYTLLPGHYALLPGGYKVTIVASEVSPAQVGANLQLATGAYRVSGYRAVANTAIRNPLASEFIVTPGAVVRQQSQYVETTVSSFYQAQALAANAAAPRLPIDAGRLVLSALNSLSFEGTSDFSFAPGGRGGQADIVGTNIEVVGAGDTAAAGVVAISDSSINNIGAQSVLIGGVRTMSNFSDPNQIQITQPATSIEISSHAVLSAPEIMLRATSTLTLDSGAVIDTTQAGALPDYLPIDPKTGRSLGSIVLTDGAFLMASNAPTPVPVILTSSGSGAKPSSLVVGAGARVDAGSSLVLANVSNFNLNASAAFGARAIAISAPVINIGGQSTSGITLTGALLSALTRGDPVHGIGPTAFLTLNAGQAVDVYGSAALGGAGATPLGSLTISTPVIQGFGAAGDVATISANELTLLGASTSTAAAGPGQGALALDATELTLGTGDLNFGGFSSLTFSASSQLIGSGIGVYGITGNLVVSAPLVTGNAGADTTLNATGAVSFLPSQVAAVAPITQVQSIGAHLTVNAASIAQDTDISLPSGVINLNATSDVTLAAGSVTDVSGALTPFFDVVRISPAGAINLASQGGNVVIAAGATVDLAGGNIANVDRSKTPVVDLIDSDLGGDVGTLSIVASNGTTSLDGFFNVASVAGYKGAQVSMNLNSGDAGTLLAAVQGFSGKQALTLATGDITVGNITAQDVELSANAGSILVAGPVSTGNMSGGIVRLTAHDNLEVANSITTGTGGSVFLGLDGNSAGKLTLDAGSAITTVGGQVWLRAPRIGDAGLAIVNNGVTLTGANSVTVEAVKAYDITNSSGGSYVDQNLTIMSSSSSTTATISNGSLTFITGTNLAYQPGQAVSIIDNSNTAASMIGTITSYDPTTGQLVVKVTTTSPGSGNVTAQSWTINTPLADAYSYMTNSSSIGQSLGGLASINGFQLLPGIEFRSGGDMTLIQAPSSTNTGIDLHGYRFNGAPPVLTLRAAGNFTMNGSLSDGFGSPVASPDGNIFAIAPLLPAGTRSATLRLVAGANLAGADPDALIAKDVLAAGSGAINFNDPHNDASGYPIPSVLRTGTGDLDIAAAGSVALLTPFGIYTAGTQSGAVSGFTAPTRLMVKSARSGAVNSYLGFQSYNKSTKTGVPYDSLYPALAFYPSYPEGGGDLTVTVQGSLTSASVKGRTGALYAGSESDTFWLWTEGQQSGQRINNGTAFINFGTYYQTFNGGGFSGTDVAPSVAAFRGLGALGGGNASISVGGDMTNVDVAVPVTLRAPAGATSWPSVTVTGGGNLQLNVAGALNNANIIVGQGVGTVHAADIGSNASVTLTPEGDAQLSAIADRSMTVLVGDATRSVAQGGGIPFGLDGCEGAVIGACSSKLPYGFFSSYTQNTAFDVLAMGGNITLNGDFVPPIMDVVAATGSITSTQALTSSNGPATGLVGYGSILIALPASTAQLNLLAGQDIKSTGISMTGVMPVPTPATFQSDYAATIFNFQNQMGSTVASDLIQPNDPHTVHVYALGSLKNIFLATPKRTDVRAGLDILSPVFELQNYLTTDVSLVEAGRDIYSGTPIADAFNIRLGGPGTLDVVAGRNITIQTPPQQTANNSPQGMGISSIGNADNPLLPTTGASLNIMAGVGQNGPDIAAFISTYFDPANAAGVLQNYTPDLVKYMQQLESNPALAQQFNGNSVLTAAQALADFRLLAPKWQLPLIAQVYFDELRAGGEAAANGQGAGGKGYDRAYKAIETLFPGSNIGTPTTAYPGDLSVYQLGRIRTEAGGDINILVPGGNIALGIENQTPNLSGQTDTARPGVLTLRDGNINTFSDGSVIVAQSRVFTELGGNILMFSTNGDLNAGKGKKTTLVTSPPQFTVDPYGNVTKAPVTPQTGAGIATLIGVPGVPPGNVDLFAPHGTIDAGDAGIRVSGNVTLQALQILNANNIQVQGTAVGIPTVQGPPVGALTTANNTAGATQTVTPQKADNGGDRPSIVIVEFIGFGGGDGSTPEDTNQHDTREKHSLNEPHYDPNSMFQIVGSGELSGEQKKLLTGETGGTLAEPQR